MPSAEEIAEVLGGDVVGNVKRELHGGAYRWSCICGESATVGHEHNANLALYHHRQREHTRSVEFSNKQILAVSERLALADWDVSVWLNDGNHIAGRVDIADRQRLVIAVLEAMSKAGADGPRRRG